MSTILKPLEFVVAWIMVAWHSVLTTLGLPGFAQVRSGVDGSATAGPLLVAASSLPISASEIRRRVREGRSLAYRLPDSVVGYIREHHLYRSDQR